MNLSIEIETQVNTESWPMLKIHEGWRQQKEAPFKIHFKKKIRMHSILDNTLRHRNKSTRAHKSKNNHHSAASCRTLCHVTKVRSSQTGFSSSSVNNKFTVLQWIQQSTFGMWLNETIALTNLHQLCDAFMSAWTKMSEEHFQQLHESMRQRITAVLKTKRRPTWFYQDVNGKW